MRQGFVVWLTGLSGSGKTTIAHELAARLLRDGQRVEVIDRDVIREHLSKGPGLFREDRDTNIRRIAFVADLLTRNGVVVITAAISPYRATRDEARATLGRFVEVFVKSTLNELVHRDTTGLYEKALRGEIADFTGIFVDPYEEPLAPEVIVETDRESIAESVGKVWAAAQRLGYLHPCPTAMPGSAV